MVTALGGYLLSKAGESSSHARYGKEAKLNSLANEEVASLNAVKNKQSL
jgi:hypothetical protein